MKIFCFLLLVVAVNCRSLHGEWQLFKQSHGKSYENQIEELQRMAIFEKNRLMIEDHNKNFEQGLVTYFLEMNHFGDLMEHELRPLLGGNRTPTGREDGWEYVPSNKSLPDQVDWRKEGAVSPVKYEVLCEADWAFSAAGALEGLQFRKTGKLVPLSAQSLIDCSWNYGNKGCYGGTAQNAFKYTAQNGGLVSQYSYPYLGFDTFHCFSRKTEVAANNTWFVSLPSGDEAALKDVVANAGPVSVRIDARDLLFYRGGVHSSGNCSTTSLNLSMLVVGYGRRTVFGSDIDYWILKNAYGTSWGEDGFLFLARDKDNYCGVASDASYPV